MRRTDETSVEEKHVWNILGTAAQPALFNLCSTWLELKCSFMRSTTPSLKIQFVMSKGGVFFF